MSTFLFKTEPSEYSFEDLVREKHALWTGVSNPAALAHLRTAKPGDDVLFYHTGSEKSIVGLARIASKPYPDPARPGLNARAEVAFPVVDIKPLKAAPSPVPLAAVKSDPRFKAFALVKQARLSIMPVPPALDKALRTMAGL